MKQIIVTIEEDGKSTVEAQCFKGKTCQDATKEIESALGSVTATKIKPEYHQKAAIHQKIKG